MRSLLLLASFVLLTCAGLFAQDPTLPSLQRILDPTFEVALPIDACAVPAAVVRLARRHRVLAGVEYLPGNCVRLRREVKSEGSLNLGGLSVAEALDKLVALDPRYRWIDANGVIVVRPVEAWADPKNLLNFTTESFALEDAILKDALSAIISAIHGRPSEAGENSRTTEGGRLFSLKIGATSVGGALDAIARTHGDTLWQLHDFAASQNFRMLSLHTFDGSVVLAPIHSAPR